MSVLAAAVGGCCAGGLAIGGGATGVCVVEHAANAKSNQTSITEPSRDAPLNAFNRCVFACVFGMFESA
jgi:hypothetical protein